MWWCWETFCSRCRWPATHNCNSRGSIGTSLKTIIDVESYSTLRKHTERFGGLTKEQFAKLPLFPTIHGEAVPKEQRKRFVENVAKPLQEPFTDALGRERFGRHTWRGTGTEFLIAMMIALWQVKLFGKWAPGSKAVHRYVRTAPLRQSRLLASHALAGGGDWRESEMSISGTSDLKAVLALVEDKLEALDNKQIDIKELADKIKNELKVADTEEKVEQAEVMKKCDFAMLFEEAFKRRTLGKFNGADAELVLNLKEDGKLHTVAFADVRSSKDNWQTICGWHFARSSAAAKRHAMRGDGPDCPVCKAAEEDCPRRANKWLRKTAPWLKLGKHKFVASEDESGSSIPGSPSSASSSNEENGRGELGRGEQVALSKMHGIST